MNGEELSKYLEFKGVDTTDLTPEDLDYFIRLKQEEIQSFTGVPIFPVQHEYFKRRFHSDQVVLPFYPVSEIISLRINGEEPETIYDVIAETGVIYFDKQVRGVLRIDYKAQLSNSSLVELIDPLIRDMAEYDLSQDPTMGATSVKEGDVSIGYDSSLSLGSRILQQLDYLRNYIPRVRWL